MKRRSRNNHGTKTMIQAITDALALELENDENVVVLVKMSVKTVGYSVQQKDCKKNLAKNAF